MKRFILLVVLFVLAVPSFATAQEWDDSAEEDEYSDVLPSNGLVLSGTYSDEGTAPQPFRSKSNAVPAEDEYDVQVDVVETTVWYNSPWFWGTVAVGVLGGVFVMDQVGVFDKTVSFTPR